MGAAFFAKLEVRVYLALLTIFGFLHQVTSSWRALGDTAWHVQEAKSPTGVIDEISRTIRRGKREKTDVPPDVPPVNLKALAAQDSMAIASLNSLLTIECGKYRICCH